MIELRDIISILVNGVVIASSLFMVSSGLSIVFGISRISNFAHGSLYMLGAYIGYSAATRFPSSTLGFFAAAIVTALAVALVGAIIEIVLLRRIYNAPHHLQLIATFGVFMMLRDLALLIWGPQELFAPRVPGFEGAARIFGHAFPAYYIVIIVMSVITVIALWLLFHATRWGVLLRAATQDRDMVAALGVDQKWLFTGVFVLSAFLAGLAGVLDVPRVPANLGMDLSIIIEAFAVVVVGGMGSIIGCFIAALIVGILTAIGNAYFQQLSLALVFIFMAIVLVVRPRGFFGKNAGASWEDPGGGEVVMRPAGPGSRKVWIGFLILLAVMPLLVSDYYLDTLTELLILVLFSWSFYFIAGTGGMMSFGQASLFGIGIYAPALLNKYFGLTMLPGILVAPVAAGLGAMFLGAFAVRLSGIYFAMLTLAFAQIVWSVTFQWFELTNGELGILNLWAAEWARGHRTYYYLTLVLSVGGILLLRRIVFSPFGQSLRAARDSEMRAEATGISTRRQKWIAFSLAGTMSGLAGVLMLYLKGSAFPSYLDIGASFDVFVMALLGGLQSLNGPIVGATIYRFLKTVLQSNVYHWNMILGAILVLLALFMPRGVSGLFADIRGRFSRAPASAEVLQ